MLAIDSSLSETVPCAGPREAAHHLNKSGCMIAVVYRPPVHAIAVALAGGMPAMDALSKWKRGCAAILKLRRDASDRVRLVETTDRNRPDTETETSLRAAMTGADWPKGADWPDRARHFEPLAALLVLSDAESGKMIGELYAATSGGVTGLPESGSALQSLIATWRDALNRQAPASAPDSPQTEDRRRLSEQMKFNAMLRAQIADLETAIVEARHCHAAETRKLSEQKHLVAVLQTQLADLRAAIKEDRTRHAATIRELAESQRLNARLRADLADLHAAMTRLRDRHEAGAHKLADARLSIEVLKRQIVEMQDVMIQLEHDKRALAARIRTEETERP